MSISLIPHRDSTSIDQTKGSDPVAVEPERKGVTRNALRHGMSGSGLALPDAEAQHAVAIEDGLLLDFQPTTARERLLIKQMSVYHIKAQQCNARQHEVRARMIDRTTLFWDTEKRLEAVELAKKLDEDPEATAIKLTLFKQGVDWIIGVLVHLLSVLDKGDLSPTQRKQALDVMGLPLDFRTGPVDIFDDPEPATQVEKRRRLIRQELERLQTLVIEHHINLDQANYRRVARGLAPELDQELRLFARYERDALRRFQWAWEELKQFQKQLGRGVETASRGPSISLTKQAVEAEMGMTTEELQQMVEDFHAHRERSAKSAPSTTISVTSNHLKGNRRQRRAQQALSRKPSSRPERATSPG